jgi:hypothetical protein
MAMEHGSFALMSKYIGNFAVVVILGWNVLRYCFCLA